jgi:hypothetical protein
MQQQRIWLTTIATSPGQSPRFCYPHFGHDALSVVANPGPPVKTSPRRAGCLRDPRVNEYASYSRRQLLANAAIAAVAVRRPAVIKQHRPHPAGAASALKTQPTTTPSAATSKSESFQTPDG